MCLYCYSEERTSKQFLTHFLCRMNEENRKEWTKINQEMEAYDESREKIIKELRSAQKNSKVAIYALQKGDMGSAKEKIAAARVVILNHLPIVTSNPDLRRGTFSAAVEEYVEAKCFERFLEKSELILKSELAEVDVTNEEVMLFISCCCCYNSCFSLQYLGGVSDLVGEMIRYSVLEATKRNVEAVRRCRDLANDILQAFMTFSLKNGNLRKKSDSIKYGVKRFEEILYDLSLKIPEGKRLDPGDFDEEKGSDPRESKKSKIDDE